MSGAHEWNPSSELEARLKAMAEARDADSVYARTVSCPHCGALEGARCIAMNGNRRAKETDYSHVRRVEKGRRYRKLREQQTRGRP